MPYVQVWVDEDPCDGDCESAEEARELEAKIKEAESLLRRGEAEAALHALTGDPSIPIKSPNEMASDYARWKEGKLPGFTNYQQSS